MKKQKYKKRKPFVRPTDPYWNPDDEEDYLRAYGEEVDDGGKPENPRTVVVNQSYIQAFVDEYQPEHNERDPNVQALTLGELREKLHIYRTFDCKTEDPLLYYIEALACHGFGVQMSFSGEMAMLVRRRNNGRGMLIE